MKAAGFDWLFLDLEHGSMSIETACEICDRGPGLRHRADRARALRRARHGDPRARRRRARHRHPPCRHRRGGRARSPTSCAIRRSAIARSAAARRSSTTRRMKMADMTKAHQRQHADHGDDRDAQGGAQRRGDRRRAGHRQPAGRLDGIPVQDLIGGGENAFRRPAVAAYVEPGVAWARGNSTFTLSIPVRIFYKLPGQSDRPATDRQAGWR